MNVDEKPARNSILKMLFQVVFDHGDNLQSEELFLAVFELGDNL